MKRLTYALALWLFAVTATAAEGTDRADSEPVESLPTSPQASPAPSTPDADPEEEEAAPASAGASSPDVFVPSEEISEDLSIAFPVDI